MANILKVNEQNTIQQLAAQGWSQRRISRELKVDRKTVRRYLTATAKSPTLSTPGASLPEVKSPGVSTPGKTTGVALVTEAVPAETGRPSFCEPHRRRIDTAADRRVRADIERARP